jgi:hypothetical protein
MCRRLFLCDLAFGRRLFLSTRSKFLNSRVCQAAIPMLQGKFTFSFDEKRNTSGFRAALRADRLTHSPWMPRICLDRYRRVFPRQASRRDVPKFSLILPTMEWRRPNEKNDGGVHRNRDAEVSPVPV